MNLESVNMERIEQSGTCEDEPTPKRLRTSQECAVTSHWAHLPSLLLTEIFSMLNKEERRNASAVCKNWRKNYFQPRWWSSMKFSIKPRELKKARFLIESFGLTVRSARIVLNSVSSESLKGLIYLLQNLARNNNLKDLVIEYAPVVQPYSTIQDEDRSSYLEQVANLLNMCLPRLSRFAADCMGTLSLSEETILENLNPSLVTSLELTYMTSSISRRNLLDTSLFMRLKKLEELSIDHYFTTDKILEIADSCKELKKVVLYQRIRRYISCHQSALGISRRFIQMFMSCDVIHSRIIKGKSLKELVVQRFLLF